MPMNRYQVVHIDCLKRVLRGRKRLLTRYFGSMKTIAMKVIWQKYIDVNFRQV
jgi:hypothetical protein